MAEKYVEKVSDIVLPSAAFDWNQVKELFERFDTDGDNSLSMNELLAMLQHIGNNLTALPAVSRIMTCNLWSRRLKRCHDADGTSRLSTRQIYR